MAGYGADPYAGSGGVDYVDPYAANFNVQQPSLSEGIAYVGKVSTAGLVVMGLTTAGILWYLNRGEKRRSKARIDEVAARWETAADKPKRKRRTRRKPRRATRRRTSSKRRRSRR